MNAIWNRFAGKSPKSKKLKYPYTIGFANDTAINRLPGIADFNSFPDNVTMLNIIYRNGKTKVINKN